jgi:rubrerythrin
MAVHEEGLTALEALGVAVRNEMDSIELYQELADRCRDSDKLACRRFELLAADEAQHREFLIAKWKELAGNLELKPPPSQLPRDRVTREQRQRMNLEDVLKLAMEEERRARELYLRAARETEDLSGQAMFRFLADIEYKHWVHLAQELDLLARYPNYLRPGPQPWHPEPGLGSRGPGETPKRPQPKEV